MPCIEIRDLCVRHGDLVAVDGVDLTVDAETVVAILGPNGAGKTTLIETLEGFRSPDEGSVKVLGLDPHAQHSQLVGRMGIMLQEGGIQTGIRPTEALELYAALADDPLDPDRLLARVGLEDRAHTAWRHLSGGEQRRLSLALAVIGRPEVLFLDEPTAGVDAVGRRLIHEMVAELRASGACIVLASHDLADTERLADTVVIIDHGRVAAHDSPDALRREITGAEIRFGAPAGIDATEAEAVLGAPVVEDPAGEYSIALAPTPTNVAALTAWLAAREIPLADLQAGRQSLDKVLAKLTSEASVAEPGVEPGGRRRRTRGRRTGRA